MPDEIPSPAIPVTAKEAAPQQQGNAAKDSRPEHLALWYDAKDENERKAAVAKHPKLRTIFSEAQNY